MTALPYHRTPQPRAGGRFQRRPFDETYMPVPESGCWLTLHHWDELGYGRTGVKGQSTAHRRSWILHRGEIPTGLCVCHKCDTPACVNPDHLFLGTNKENAHDRDRKGRLKPRRGSKNGAAVLNEAKAMEIRLSKEPQDVLAKRYGVTASTISKIATGRTWRSCEEAA